MMGSKIKIAIIDSGINTKFAENVKCENELVVEEDNSCRENFSKNQPVNYLHGTICSLIIAKYCPECVFSSIRILNQEGKGGIEKIEPAFEWCMQNDVKIVNLSLGTTHFKENSKLNKLINRFASQGLIIIAAISNIGYFTFPASFTNVIGVATEDSPLLYRNDFIHLGIDAVVPSVHEIRLDGREHKTSLSNSYAAPYVSALIAQKMLENETWDLHKWKKFVRTKSQIAVDDLYYPDWIHRAYLKENKNQSRVDYYFETITGNYEDIEHEIDTIIVYSKAELEHINFAEKNLIYLGKDDAENITVSGFKWSWQTRVQQIARSRYQGNGLDIPLVFVDIKEGLDKYFILSEFRRYFENDGYHAYVISMEPESVLYGFEYIPVIQTPLSYKNVKNFMEGQAFYKQSDLILWNIGKGQETDICNLYPDFDVKIKFNDTEILLYIEKKLCYTEKYCDLSGRHIKDIYDMITNCLAEEKNGE